MKYFFAIEKWAWPRYILNRPKSKRLAYVDTILCIIIKTVKTTVFFAQYDASCEKIK
jgi:hypothetical protein